MATQATTVMLQFANDWIDEYPSAVLGGVVGDLSHAQRGGYHISIEDQVDDQNYSVVREDDKAPPGQWARDCASAVDITMALSDMFLCHGRLVAAWLNRDNDPRAQYINAHNGWDGAGSAGRYDWVTGAVKAASDDHKWHIHLEFKRRYANDPKAMAAVLSIVRGETVDDWEDRMTPAQFLTLLDDPQVAARMKTLAGQGVHSQRLGASKETIGQDLASDDNAAILLKLAELSSALQEIRAAVIPPPPAP